MKILFFLFLLSFVCIPPVFSATYTGVININGSNSAGSNCTKGNGNIKSESRSLDSFQEITLSGSFTVSIHCANGHKALLTVDSNILPLIQTTVSNNTLHIDTTTSICVENPIKVSLTAPVIKKINAHDSNEITMECATGYETLEVVLSGASNFKLIGNGQSLTAILHDATELDASKNIVKSAQVTAAGSSTAVVVAQQNIIATSSDASEIYYNDAIVHIQKTIRDAGDILPLSEK
jgi:hypothetical protein